MINEEKMYRAREALLNLMADHGLDIVEKFGLLAGYLEVMVALGAIDLEKFIAAFRKGVQNVKDQTGKK